MEQKPAKSAFDREASAALKGIAILMMMFHHNFRAAELYAGHAVSFFPFGEQQVVNAAFACKICVSIFAFISGYGLFLSYQGYAGKGTATRWCAKRYVKTFSGYWFVWVLSAVICQLIDGRTGHILLRDGGFRCLAYGLIDFAGLAKLFETPSVNGTWWYMSAAAAFIALLPLAYRLRDELGLVLAGSVLFLRVIFGRNGSGVYTGGNSIYAFLSPFLIGCMFARYGWFDKWAAVGRGRRWTRVYKLIVELWLILLGYKLYHKLPVESFWEFHYGLFPTLVILFYVEYLLPVGWLRRGLGFLGRHSMNVFFIHTFIRGYYLADLTYSLGHFAVITLALLGVSVALSVVIEALKKVLKYDQWVNKLV